jgi:phosphoribosylformylglycinamidine cyclo-ligase
MPHDQLDSIDYKQAGVDIAAGEQAVKSIKHKVRTTYGKNVLSELGSFGGLFRIDKDSWRDPILVSSTDGVGTKIMVAIKAGKYDTVGQDLVNHCVNDILVQGAIPQFFLDYIGVGKLDPAIIEIIIDGFVKACRENDCALIGGEMAEMPGLYQERDFDLAGTIVGMVEESELLPRQSIAAGDLLVGLPSNGLHTNGYSLARKVLFDKMQLDVDSYMEDLGESIGAALLRVHRSYLSELRPHLTNPELHALAHITGGGIAGNLARVLPSGLQAEIHLPEKEIPPIFQIIREGGNVRPEVMRQSFNLGIGMIVVCSDILAQDLCSKYDARVLGKLGKTASDKKVVFV